MEQQVLDQTLAAAQQTEKLADSLLANYDLSDIESLRRRRVAELKARAKQEAIWRQIGHGTYQELADEAQWFEASKSSQRLICHFYRSSTWRCEIIDKHLEKICKKHIETRFVKINAEKCNFLAERLEIVLLPTLICTSNNYTQDRIEGFDELGGTDKFTTETLERRLAKKGCIEFDESAARAKEFAQGKGGQLQQNVRDNPQGAPVYQSKRQEIDSECDDSD